MLPQVLTHYEFCYSAPVRPRYPVHQIALYMLHSERITPEWHMDLENFHSCNIMFLNISIRNFLLQTVQDDD